MVRKSRVREVPDVPKSGATPRQVTKAEFGERVYRLMLKVGLRQADLARKAELTRDDISRYVNGRTFPTPQSLDKLAKALGTTAVELLPNQARAAIEDAHPSLEMRVSPDNPRVAWLRINQLVTVATASKIIALLEEGHAADGKGSR